MLQNWCIIKLNQIKKIDEGDVASAIEARTKHQSFEKSIPQEDVKSNTKDSLTAKDTEYMSAVERGDIGTAQKIVDEAVG